MTLAETRTDEFTWADIASTPADGLRREIIGGSLIVNPAPFIRHQQVAFRLATFLDRTCRDDARVLVAPVDWRYDHKGVVEPDVVVIPRNIEIDGLIPAVVVPELVGEVLSSNATFDQTVKRDLYQRLRVPTYWLVDPGGPHREVSIVALSLGVEGVYEIETEAKGVEQFSTDRPFPISFAPDDLLR